MFDRKQLAKAEQEGYMAYFNQNVSAMANPYCLHTQLDLYKAWEKGRSSCQKESTSF